MESLCWDMLGKADDVFGAESFESLGGNIDYFVIKDYSIFYLFSYWVKTLVLGLGIKKALSKLISVYFLVFKKEIGCLVLSFWFMFRFKLTCYVLGLIY